MREKREQIAQISGLTPALISIQNSGCFNRSQLQISFTDNHTFSADFYFIALD
jgi:hypothetical protein